MDACSLFELNEFIRRVLALNFQEPLWVRCELAEVKFSRGHVYLDLVQKSPQSEEIIAQGQAVVWQRKYRDLEKKFGLELGALLRAGQSVLMLVKVEFHERYGLKLQVEDFDSAYTLGQLELRRQQTIRELEREGLLEKNRQLPLPLVIQRIAVITSETAAGYQDFLQHLNNNQFGYRFELCLLKSAMQGVQVDTEVSRHLEWLAVRPGEFDAVCILRGGGAKLDLAAFDSPVICRAATALPTPLLTGIGHEVDQTVLDLVANTALKTPTAVADFILHHNLDFESSLLRLSATLRMAALQQLSQGERQLRHLSQLLQNAAENAIRRQQLTLEYIDRQVPVAVRNLFHREHARLESLERAVEYLNPETVLRRGYSLAIVDGQLLRRADQVHPGDEVEVRLQLGKFTSTVKSVENE
jgi:exodeoxyribonuclease VII large subunit